MSMATQVAGAGSAKPRRRCGRCRHAGGACVSRMITVRAPAKVNLALAVGGLRPDGYHEVHTVLQAIALYDRVTIEPADELQLECDSPGAGQGPANIGWRAAELLRRAAGVPDGARIRIRKRIPVQAGLGGGSADAAAVLLGCCRVWRLNWSAERLADLAAQLGADVPFFLHGGTCLGEGRGERVRPLVSLPAWPIVVAHPGPGVSTTAAYGALDDLVMPPSVDVAPVVSACEASPAQRRALVAASMGNAFEAAILPLRPDIAALRRQLQEAGASAVLLCGSGAAVWALAPNVAWARQAAHTLREEGLWAVATRFWPRGVVPGSSAARGERV